MQRLSLQQMQMQQQPMLRLQQMLRMWLRS
jgi:hypothetical protein